MLIAKIVLISLGSFFVIWNVIGLIRDISKNRKKKRDLKKEIEANENTGVD